MPQYDRPGGLHCLPGHRRGERVKPRHFLLFVLVCLVWASNNVLSKTLVSHWHVPPLFYTTMRFAIVLVCTLPWLRPAPRPLWRIAALGVLMGGGRYDGLTEYLDGPPTPGIGPASVRRLLEAFGLPEDIFGLEAYLEYVVMAPRHIPGAGPLAGVGRGGRALDGRDAADGQADAQQAQRERFANGRAILTDSDSGHGGGPRERQAGVETEGAP